MNEAQGAAFAGGAALLSFVADYRDAQERRKPGNGFGHFDRKPLRY
jgi:hypothetical protein